MWWASWVYNSCKITGRRMACYAYFDTHLSVSAISLSEAWASTTFFLLCVLLVEHLPNPWAPCFLDLLATVTWSSTCTSLTTNFEGWLLCSSAMGRTDEPEAEPECLSFRDELVLCTGLICVPMSLLERAVENMVLASLVQSFSSTRWISWWL